MVLEIVLYTIAAIIVVAVGLTIYSLCGGTSGCERFNCLIHGPTQGN